MDSPGGLLQRELHSPTCRPETKSSLAVPSRYTFPPTYNMLDSLQPAACRVENPYGPRPLLDIISFSELGLDCSSAMTTEFGGQLFARLGEGVNDDGLWKVVFGELGRLGILRCAEKLVTQLWHSRYRQTLLVAPSGGSCSSSPASPRKRTMERSRSSKEELLSSIRLETVKVLIRSRGNCDCLEGAMSEVSPGFPAEN